MLFNINEENFGKINREKRKKTKIGVFFVIIVQNKLFPFDKNG